MTTTRKQEKDLEKAVKASLVSAEHSPVSKVCAISCLMLLHMCVAVCGSMFTVY
jgi:hypothetical protein